MAQFFVYDILSDVAETWVQWKFDFQSGFRVLKMCDEPFLIYIYGKKMWSNIIAKTIKFSKFAKFAI